jgi:type II secretory pathway pseudopilin PulG
MARKALAGGRPRIKASKQGFTLVELLIGVALTSLVLGSLAVLAVQQMQLANRVVGFTDVNRNFQRLSDLLKIETGEACILRKGVSPRTTATLPDTPCKPQATSACATPSSANELWLLVAIQDGINGIAYAPIRYYLSGTDLLRDGPQVDDNGLLTTTSATGSRVLTNISRFVPEVSTDCTWVSLDVGVTYPGRAEVRRSLSLYSGASMMVN